MIKIIKNTFFILFLLLFFSIININAKTVKIARDKTQLKDGPGNYFDIITVLKIGTPVEYIKKSTEDSGWIEVKYKDKKGFISKIALKESVSTDYNPFSEFNEEFDTKKSSEIAPASYTAAIKGFALDYARKKGFDPQNLDELLALTEFKKKDYNKVMRETDMAYFPKDDGELIGIEEGFINDRMEAIGLTVSLNVLKQGVVTDEEMTKRLNVIANILNRQTWDYDVTYRVWIIKDSEPVAYSGPGGFIFVSSALLEILTDYRELVAIMAHEVGHIAMRHGIRDIAVEQARYSAEKAFDELDEHMDEDTLEVSEELDEVIDKAMEACALVRDDKEEYEADSISKELLRRYKIESKYLIDALNKMTFALGDKYPQYKKQIQKRIKKLKRDK